MEKVQLMFREKTVFVLGAGSSFPYGYPLGETLIKHILDDMSDEIFLPTPMEREGFYFNTNDEKQNKYYPFNWWKNNVNISAQIGKNTNFSKHPLGHYETVDRKISFLRKCPIKSICEFKSLHDALMQFNPISIDTFLRDNPSFGDAGKTMIVYSLLKRESLKKLAHGNSNDWYAYLINDLVSECADDAKNLLENNLDIITFNYDISLDYYIYDRLKSIEIFNDADDLASKFLNKFEISHVYGCLEDKNRLPYGGYFGCSGETEMSEWTFKRFLDSIILSKRIHTMYDERTGALPQKNEEHIKKLSAAKNVIFIGFGFDRDNLNQIGLPSTKNNWVKFIFPTPKNNWINSIFPGKQIGMSPEEIFLKKNIKWLNYCGKMRGLSNQFNTLDLSIVESKADNIITAYQNDFKSSLF